MTLTDRWNRFPRCGRRLQKSLWWFYCNGIPKTQRFTAARDGHSINTQPKKNSSKIILHKIIIYFNKKREAPVERWVMNESKLRHYILALSPHTCPWTVRDKGRTFHNNVCVFINNKRRKTRNNFHEQKFFIEEIPSKVFFITKYFSN